jgi:hypothetical protein
MEPTNNETRVAEHASARSEEEARDPEATAITVVAMLANPRRTRRN